MWSVLSNNSRLIFDRIIPNLHEEVKSRNPTVRIHNAEYLYLILSIFPEESYLNHIATIEDLLTNLL